YRLTKTLPGSSSTSRRDGMEEDRFRRCSSKTARRRLRSLLVLAADYLKYLFTSRRRLLHRVARRTQAVFSSYQGKSNKRLPPYHPPRALMEHEFSCSNSPSPAFLAAKRLQSRLKRGAAAGAAVASCFGAPPLGHRTGRRQRQRRAMWLRRKMRLMGWPATSLSRT
uniref:Uncharacterized protein n=1 Tax=Aegilops tauschii subsp. strangulata TaxID=200361 RepID=A0A453CH78_AEGTS